MNKSYSTQIPSIHPFTLEDRMRFIPLTEPNPTNNLKEVKVSRQIDSIKCDEVSSINNNNNTTTTTNTTTNNNNRNKCKAIPILAPWAAGGFGSQNS